LTTTNGTDVVLGEDAWTDIRGDRHFLKTVVWINGTPFHLEAVEVRTTKDGVLEAVASEDEETLGAVSEIYDGRWETMRIGGSGTPARKYVAYAVPFCR